MKISVSNNASLVFSLSMAFSFCVALSLSSILYFLLFVLISHHILLIYAFFLFIHSLSHSLTPTLTFNLNPPTDLPPSPHSQSTCQSWLSSGLPLTLQSGSLALPLERFGLAQRFLSDRAHLATVPGLSSDRGWPDYEGRLPLPS